MSAAVSPVGYVVERVVRKQDGTWGQNVNERTPVIETQQDSPPPVNYTRAWNQGKTFNHAWAHMWRWIPLNIRSINAIQALHFEVPKVPGAMVIAGVPGRQNPIRERVNIKSPGATSYGSLAEVTPQHAYDPRYAKLM